MKGILAFSIAGILFCTLFLSIDCRAQKILVFDRDGHSKRIRFRLHDEIAVLTADGESWYEGEITNIEDSTITVSYIVISVSTIKSIAYDSRSSGAGLLRVMGAAFPIAGVALLSITAINSVINHDYPVYSQSVLIVSGALILTGPVTRFFTHHKYKINEHHRLKVIDISIR